MNRPHRSCCAVAAAAAVALAVAPGHGQMMWFVDDDAGPGGDGGSWSTALDDLQDALGAAMAGDEIRVAAGTYVPGDPGDPRSVSFELPAGVRLLGGFAGPGALEPDVQDPDVYITVLSGDLVGNDGSVFEDYGDNCYHVLLHDDPGAPVELDGFVVTGGNGGSGRGGGLRIERGDLIISRCLFQDNLADVAAAVDIVDDSSSTVSLTACTLTGNVALVGGTLVMFGSELILRECEFSDNYGDSAGAIVMGSGSSTIVSCTFARNTSGFVGGAADVALHAQSTWVNCVFSRNDASHGGALVMGDSFTTMTNCSFSGNGVDTINTSEDTTLLLANCIVRGGADSIVGPGSVTIRNSDIEGGWDGSGSGNIDADPLFLQPEADNLRLALGSPCIDQGFPGALPADELDLDGDGDTSEPIPWDLDGNPRIVGASVDMGAYEGGYESLPPAAFVGDFDQGEAAILVPEGGFFDPLESGAAVLINTAGPDNATALLTQHDDDVHSDAGGFSELGITLELETTLQPGELFTTAYLPFETGQLGGRDPFDLEPTAFDPSSGDWALAVAGNTQNSPGHAGPVGDRITAQAPDPWGVTLDVGDYGVFWDAGLQQGFVWANVDRAGDFAFGVPMLCPADCAGDDGVVNVDDLVAVILFYGQTGSNTGGCDINGDGIVDLFDLNILLNAWGPCEGA